MEDNITCDICSLEFNNTRVIPKVLQCGHSFCSPCIAKILQSNPLCPQCRKMIKGPESSFPINYSILKIVHTYSSLKKLDSHLALSTKKMTHKYMLRKDLLSKKKSQIESYLEVIESGLTKLQELTESDNRETNSRKTKRLLLLLEEDFKKTDEFLHFNFWKLNLPVSISLKNYEGQGGYLAEIYDRLMEDEEIYAVKKIEDSIKYGKLSIYDNKLMLNSLSLTETPQGSSLILFDDLKQCAHSLNLRTFIKIVCNSKNSTHTLVFQMLDRNLSELLIKLCTGECGPSLKDCFYRKGKDCLYNYESILHIDSELEAKKLMEYTKCIFPHQTEVRCSSNEMLLEMKPDGNLELYHTVKGSVITWSPQAKLIYHPSLKDCISYDDNWHLRVIDCGILIFPTH